MMSLHTFDRTFPADFDSRVNLSPLLTAEALRRLAWSVFVVDSMIDGGRFGYAIADERGYRLRLPCDEHEFLAGGASGPMYPSPPVSSLGLSGHMVQTAMCRRRALNFAYRVSHHELVGEELAMETRRLEDDIQGIMAALPQHLQFTKENLLRHHEGMTMYIALHLFRQNLFVILGRARLMIYREDADQTHLIPDVRRDRISRALSTSEIVSEALQHQVVVDPLLGAHIYVALESAS